MNTFDNIVIFGDIHGDLEDITTHAKKFDIRNSAYVGVGDFGVGFCGNEQKERNWLEYHNDIFKGRGNVIYTIRGNHDNPMYFDGNHNLSNIIFLSDYTVMPINEYNFLFIGGAISVDRKPNPTLNHKGRRVGRSYWSDEGVVYDPEKINSITENVNVVVTHSAPNFCHPSDYSNLNSWLKFDDELLADVTAERESLNSIYEQLLSNGHSIEKWFYGHFHNTYSSIIENTTFKLLDKNTFIEFR